MTTISKSKISKKEKLVKANQAVIRKKISEKKDLKYIYPDACDTLKKRKKFRHSTRIKIDSFEEKIQLIQSGLIKDIKIKTVKEELAAFAKKVLVNPELYV